MKWIRLLLLGFLVLVCSDANAQMCFRGRPLPDCRTFWVTEFTYGIELAPEHTRGHIFSPDIGVMVNLNEKHAVGGSWSLEFLYNSDHPKVFLHGPKLRYRYWLRDGFNLNASAGLLLSDELELAGDLGCIYKDWMGLGLRLESWRSRDSFESHTAVYPTVTFGGIPGISLSTAFAAGLAVLYGLAVILAAESW
jgi:hypothetical protein